MILNLKGKYIQILRYGAVGILCQTADYYVTLLLFNVLDAGLVVSNSSGYMFATICSYILHSKFTFSNDSSPLRSKKQILKFTLACVTGILFGLIVLKALIFIGMQIASAKLLQLLVIAITQALLNFTITFKRKPT